MKKNVTSGGSEAATVSRKRTSRDADVELRHLESMLAGVARAARSAPFSPTYWKARVREVYARYTLLASQTARLVTIEREIAALEAALAASNSQPELRRIAA